MLRVGVLGVAVYGDVEEVGAVGWVEGAERAGQRRLVDGVIDGVKLGADRRGAGGLDGVGVEERAVQRLRLGSRAVVVVEDVADLVFGVFGKLVEGAVARIVVGQSVRVDPWAVDVTEQIVGSV